MVDLGGLLGSMAAGATASYGDHILKVGQQRRDDFYRQQARQDASRERQLDRDLRASEGRLDREARVSESRLDREVRASESRLNRETTMEAARIKSAGGATTALRTRQGKINHLLRLNPDMDESTAQRLVDNQIKVNMDPISGAMSMTDIVEGTNRQIPTIRGLDDVSAATDAQEPSTTAQRQAAGMQAATDAPMEAGGQRAEGTPTVWDLSYEGTTGIGAAISSTANQWLGQFGFEYEPEVVGKRQFLTLANKAMVRALMNNPRYAEGERKSIAEEIDAGFGAGKSANTQRAKMIYINDYLTNLREKAQDARYDRSLPKDTQTSAGQLVYHIDNYLEILGVPESQEERDAGVRVGGRRRGRRSDGYRPTAEDNISDAPSGWEESLWDALTPDEQQEVLRGRQ